jgi:pilus assembly protein Flp/PilA
LCGVNGWNAKALASAPQFLGARQEQSPMRHLWNFLADDAGATAIEYALIGSLVALAIVTILLNLGSQLSAEFSEVSSALK